MHKAVEELAGKDTFRGYGPEQGYDFLIEAIIKNDFAPRGIHFSASEIFVSDGAKSDTGNIGDILRHDNSVGVYRSHLSGLYRQQCHVRDARSVGRRDGQME